MQLLRVIDPASQVFADSLGIIHSSISAAAQLPHLRLEQLLASGQYQLFAYVDGKEAVGAALIYFSEQLRFAWLDYFAIRENLRGRGLGSSLFGAIVQLAQSQNPAPDWLLLEVDDDREGDLQHQALCDRRIGFYRRLGARLLENVPYRFPSAFGAPIPMRLMGCQLHPNAELSAEHLKTAVQEIFQNVHGRLKDPLFLWFEQSLPEEIEAR